MKINKSIILTFCLGAALSFGVQARDVYLHGSFNNWKDVEEYKFQPVGDSENHYRLIVTIPAGSASNPNKLKVYDEVENGKTPYRGSSSTSDKELDLNGKIKSLNSHTGSGNESSVTMSYPVEVKVCFEYWAKYKFSGDTDESYHSALKATTCPNNLYIYGHIKDGDWDKNDVYVAECEDGIYNFKDVNICGRDGKENYIAFFSDLPTPSTYGSLYPRYGGNKADKEIDADHTNGDNVVILQSDFTEENGYSVEKGIDVYLSQPTNDSNFRLHDGMYDVSVNLNDGRVTYTKVDLAYKWHDWQGNVIEAEEVTFKGTDFPMLKLSSRGDMHHPAADNAVIEVTYMANPESEDEPETVALDEENDNSAYTINEDKLIILNKVGTYTIKAALPENLSKEYTGIDPAQLTVTVQSMPTSITGHETEAGEAVYYNLQGVKVDNPEKGIFIEVRNGQSRKIRVR